MLGQPLKDAGGLCLHSGHALRVTGAQGLARAGLSLHAIQLLGRWGSNAVLLYVRQAPLYATHRYAAAALAGWGSGPVSAGSALNQWVSPPAPTSCSVASPASDPSAKFLELDNRIRELEGRPCGRDLSSDHALAARLAATEEAVADLRAASTNTKESKAELAARLADLEGVVAMMRANRTTICRSIQSELTLSTPALPAADAPVPSDLNDAGGATPVNALPASISKCANDALP